MKEKTQSWFEGSLRRPSTSHLFRGLVLSDASVGSYIRDGLEKRGYNCSLATSDEEAINLIDRNEFDLIVSTTAVELEDSLLSKLNGSRCTVVSYKPGSDFRCWLPVMSHGTKCFGAPALSPSDFIGLVDQIATEVERPNYGSRAAAR
jgi:DNA-binding NtrC family response regulator